MMTIIEVENDPLRPFLIHQPKQNGPVIQVSCQRKDIEMEAAKSTGRAICSHHLYLFSTTVNAPTEAICERDNMRFVASKVAVHAH